MPVSFSMYLLGMSAVKMRNRGFLILTHEAAVAFDIGTEDGGEFALHIHSVVVRYLRILLNEDQFTC